MGHRELSPISVSYPREPRPSNGSGRSQDIPTGLGLLSLSIDDLIVARANVLAAQPGLSAEKLFNAKAGIVTTYRKIREKTGPFDMLVYPASAGDAFPIVISPTLVMIDVSPFSVQKNKFSHAVASVDANPSQAFTFRDLANDPQIGEATKKSLLNMQEESLNYIEKYALVGHQPFYGSNSLYEIMRALYVLRVNPLDVSLQKVSRGHKMSFTLDGEQKQIYYAEVELPDPSEGYDFVPHFMDIAANGTPISRTGVLIKADFGMIAPGVLDVVRPDVLIHDLQPLLDEDPEGLESYTDIFKNID